MGLASTMGCTARFLLVMYTNGYFNTGRGLKRSVLQSFRELGWPIHPNCRVEGEEHAIPLDFTQIYHDFLEFVSILG